MRGPGTRLATLAVGWTLFTLVWAVALPSYTGEETTTAANGHTTVTHTSSTLVAVNGYWVLGLLAGPLALTLIGWWANRARLGGSRIGRRVLTGSVLLLGALCLVSIASVGLLVLPGVILLAVAGTRPPVPAH